MKVIVFGANGMAGHMVALYLQEQGHEVTGFVKSKNKLFPCIEGNALDTGLIRKIVQDVEYDFIINCIGILNKAVDAKLAEGIYINSVLPHLLEECVEGRKTRVIHISSDCVFTGNAGHYTEAVQPDAESYYGRTQALGELQSGGGGAKSYAADFDRGTGVKRGRNRTVSLVYESDRVCKWIYGSYLVRCDHIRTGEGNRQCHGAVPDGALSSG